MAKKEYDWKNGAILGEHSKRKHKILSEYFRKYLITRCQLPQQEKFRLAIVDGFCGGGVYKYDDCGSPLSPIDSYGSPLLFIDTLKKTFEEINLDRVVNGKKQIKMECYFVFNDFDKDAIEQLKLNISPLLAEIKENIEHLYIYEEYHTSKFEEIYPRIKETLLKAKYGNVIFNLDQCGYVHVSKELINNIMNTWKSAEVFLTFMISSLLTYLSTNQDKDNTLTKFPEIKNDVSSIIQSTEEPISKDKFLGKAERIVFEHLKQCALFVSPFSINNPDGCRYWFMHFANRHPARRVYNNLLHDNNSLQVHFGRSGLNMFSYDPSHEGTLSFFNDDSRQLDKEKLYDDIPKLISEHGDALIVEDFYAASYNETAAHSDDIHAMIIENPDIEVITTQGGERRKANTIRKNDILKLRKQKSFFPMFLHGSKK